MKFSYCMPATSPLYPLPPYYFKDNNSINIVFKTTEEALRALLPPPLIPNPSNLASVYVGELNVAAPLKVTYKEAGISIPVLFEGTPANYYVYLYLDTALAIVPGREIWGFPKKDAKILFSSGGGIFKASVKREGIEIIRASVTVTESIKPIPSQTDVPHLNLKIIPSVKKNHLPDVYQLTSAGLSSTPKELWMGEATLSFASSTNDPLGDLPILEIVNGAQSIGDMSLDCGDVLVDYLANNQL